VEQDLVEKGLGRQGEAEFNSDSSTLTLKTKRPNSKVGVIVVSSFFMAMDGSV
jgi:hypothetical protein